MGYGYLPSIFGGRLSLLAVFGLRAKQENKVVECHQTQSQGPEAKARRCSDNARRPNAGRGGCSTDPIVVVRTKEGPGSQKPDSCLSSNLAGCELGPRRR